MGSTFPLRDRKAAKQKLAIAQAFVKELASTAYDDIVIKDLCRKLEISEGTFYNYFSKKVDVVLFYMDVSFLRVAWRVLNATGELTATEKIYRVFDSLVDEIKSPNALYQLLAVAMANGLRRRKSSLKPVEVSFVLQVKTAMDFPVSSFKELFGMLVEQGKAKGELSKKTSSADIVDSLLITLLGGLLSIDMEGFHGLRDLYRRQLSLMWKGLKS